MNHRVHFLQLGLAILVMSSSGTLARSIDLSALTTIWIRCVIGAIALLLVIKLSGLDFRLERGPHFYWFLLSSVLLGIHWVTYFYSLHLTSVAVGMLSLFTYPIITALLEPVILKTKFQITSIMLGSLAFVGVALLVPEFTLENEYTFGIAVGVFSAVSYSFRNILLKKQVSAQSEVTLMFYQLLIVVIMLFPFVLLSDITLGPSFITHWKGLLLLGVVTTAMGHTLFVRSFRHFSISTVSVISALTPLLGSMLGFLFLGEVPSDQTFLGGSLILIAVTIESVRSFRR